MVDINEILESLPLEDCEFLVGFVFGHKAMRGALRFDELLEYEKQKIDEEVDEMSDEEVLNEYMALKEKEGEEVNLVELLQYIREFKYDNGEV